MIGYEIVPDNSLPAAELMVGIENALRSKNVFSQNAERRHLHDDEVVFHDLFEGTDIRIKVYLRPLYLSDVETLDLELSHDESSDFSKRLVLVYSKIDLELDKTFDVHARRIMDLTGCQELICYEYLPLVSNDGAGIALKKTLSIVLPNACENIKQTAPAPIDTEFKHMSEYDYHSRASLSQEELVEFLDLGILSKKWQKTTVSIDI